MNFGEVEKGDVQVSDYGNVVVDYGIAIFDPVQDFAGLDFGELWGCYRITLLDCYKILLIIFLKSSSVGHEPIN
jgi:hypothetical protein